MAKIAISYRRSDSQDITGRIFDRLAQQYGRDTVFRDIDSIQPGIDFRTQIADALTATDVLLVIVGPRWLGRGKGVESRMDNESDPVRVEVEMALKRDIPIIPVLVSGMKMPEVGQLPSTLKDFAFRHAVQVDGGRDFDHHIDGLVRTLDQFFAVKGMEPPGRQESAGSLAGAGSVAPSASPSAAGTAPQGIIGQTPPRRSPFSLPVLFGAVGILAGVALTAAVVVFLRSGRPPTFDCYSAVDPDEREICRSSELAELDRNLAVAYSVLRAHLDKDKQTALAADEGAWLERRKSCNKDDACIRAAYITRLKQLRNWQ
jgi:uncharacterized protein YecT (DUF1311 family)